MYSEYTYRFCFRKVMFYNFLVFLIGTDAHVLSEIDG